MTEKQNTCGGACSIFEGIALLLGFGLVYLMSLLLCFLPFALMLIFADVTGPIPMLLGVFIAVVGPIVVLWNDKDLWDAMPFSLFFLAPLPVAVFSLSILVFSSGGPVELREFYIPETKASIVHNPFLNVDHIYIKTHTHCDACYTITGQVDAGMEGKIHVESFSSGVEVEAIGFAAGSRTQASVLDRIVDTRQIVVKITGLNGEAVNAIIPASEFKSERYDAERDNAEIAESASHPTRPIPAPPPLTAGMTPLGSR